MKTFFIKENYIHRLDNESYDDTSSTDEWQKEVYEYAKNIFIENEFQSILDIGTGSGYKLIKYFSNFKTLGIDIPSTVSFLKEKYPTRDWSDSFTPVLTYDMIISSDVIEHIPDPDQLLQLIENCNPKLIVLSTPVRELLYDEFHSGPPKNRSHVREWSMTEFYNYINSRFHIIDHFISNSEQATQTILAKLR